MEKYKVIVGLSEIQVITYNKRASICFDLPLICFNLLYD